MNEKIFKDLYSNAPAYFGKEPSDGLVQAFETYSIPRGRALDIGAGEGRNSFYLNSIGYKVDSIEPEVEGHNKLKDHKGINPYNMGIEEYSWKNSYDFILAGTSLDQLDERVLRETASRIKENLKSGGYAYILVFTEDDPKTSEAASSINHYFKKGELLELFYDETIEVKLYNEYMKIDESHGPVHYHGKAKLIFMKK